MRGTERPNVQLQPHLGKLQEVYKPEEQMGGYLSLAKVITVHQKRNTVDVQIIKSNDIIGSSIQNEGKFGAKVLVSTAHFSNTTNTSSGVIEPIQEGQLVVLAFLDSLKNEPIIIGSFHNTWTPNNNILTNNYPLYPDKTTYDRREANKYLRVFPAQGYYRVDGMGGVEYSLPSKTFIKVDTEYYSSISDKHLSTDHKDLEEKDIFHNYSTKSGRMVETQSPVRMLLVHRTSYDDNTTTWTKGFIDTDGRFRLTRDNRDDNLTYTEMTPEGKYILRRQLDSPIHGEGQKYSQIELDDVTGSITILRKDGVNESMVQIDGDNNIYLKHDCGSYIKLDSNGDIIINATRNIVSNQGGV